MRGETDYNRIKFRVPGHLGECGLIAIRQEDTLVVFAYSEGVMGKSDCISEKELFINAFGEVPESIKEMFRDCDGALTESFSNAADLFEHLEKHVLTNISRRDGTVDCEKFDFGDPKFPPIGITPEAEVDVSVSPTRMRQMGEYKANALELAEYLPTGNSKDKFGPVIGWVTEHDGNERFIKIRRRANRKYNIPAANSPDGREIPVGNTFCEFVAYDVRDGQKDIRTYFLSHFRKKIETELAKFVRELPASETQVVRNDPEVKAFYLNSDTGKLEVADMPSSEARRLHSQQFLPKMANSISKKIYKIEGELEYPPKSNKSQAYFTMLENEYGVDFEGKIPEVLRNLSDHELSDEFISSFMKMYGVSRLRLDSEEKIAQALNDVIDYLDGDSTSPFDSNALRPLLERFSKIEAMSYLRGIE